MYKHYHTQTKDTKIFNYEVKGKMSFNNISKFTKSNFRLFATRVNTIDSKEVEHFQYKYLEWWDSFGPAKLLHSMNRLRVPLVRDCLINTGCVKQESIRTAQPLKGLFVLDVGCGAGILSEPLARLGASVTGIDANCVSIEQAKHHSKQQNLNISYEFDSVENHSSKNIEKYDAVVASEIIEHVTHKKEFVEGCIKCLKPSGSVFITTFSKTKLAEIIGIQVAENMLLLIPKGTHHLDKFITPHELQVILQDNNCRTELIHGMRYNPFTNTWSWCSDTSINYVLHAVKI